MLTIYKASAGSGKTHQLALEYVKLLLGIKLEKPIGNQKYRLNNRRPIEHNRHRGILAITFTNKATEEMKTRIINELVNIAHSTPNEHKSKFVDDLITKDMLNCSVEDLAKTADRAIHELLLDFDNFNVSTIDSFFQQVLRSLAYELDYPGDYEVVIQPETVTAQAVDLMLEDFNFNPDDKDAKSLKEQLLQIMKEQCTSGSDFNIFNRNLSVHSKLVKNVVSLFDEKYQIVSEDFENWFNTPGTSLRSYYLALKGHIDRILKQNADGVQRINTILNDQSFSSKLRKSFVTFVNRFTDPLIVVSKHYPGGIGDKNIQAVEFGLENDHIVTGGKKAPIVPDAIIGQTTSTLQQMISNVQEFVNYKALINEIATYSFIHHTNKFINRIRTDNNIVILADTNELLKRVMGDESEVSFVYEKMGVDLHHFLIDEFQDTSRMQWRNLKELVYEGLSTLNDSLIIGDEKQAIYRFRNSDSSMLHSLVENETRSRHIDVNTPHSETNWRSTEQVIRFNNSFFGRMSKHLGIDGYQTVDQKVSPKMKNVPGYVRLFNVANINTNTAENAESTESTDNSNSAENTLQDPLDVMLIEIMRELESGYQPGDIAVLVNTNGEAVRVVTKLMEKGLDVTTDEALLLNKSRAVRLIVSVMQLVAYAHERNYSDTDQPDDSSKKHKIYAYASDKVSRFEYEYSKNVLNGDDEQLAIDKAIRSTFSDESHTEITPNEVADIAAINPSTIHTLVEVIIEKRLTEAEREHEIAYISAFQDVVMSYAAIYGNDVMAFLRWWNNNSKKLTITSPNDINAIKVMTVHKSKGLQFNCVHLPFSTRNLMGDTSKVESVWIRTADLPAIATLPDDVKATMPYAIRVTLNSFTGIEGSLFKDFYIANQAERQIDGFNKNYVAFTRAERELCIYYNGNKEFGREIAAVTNYEEYRAEIDDPALVEAKLLAPFDPSLHYDLSKYLDKDGNIVIGEPTSPIKNNKEKEENNDNDDKYAEFPTPKDLVAKYPVCVSGQGTTITTVEALIEEDSGNIDDEAESKIMLKHMEDAAARGERLHYILSRINRLRDVQFATRPSFVFEFTDDDIADIHKFFNTPETQQYVNRWFRDHDRAINEMNIYDPNAPETQPKTHRPDRVVWNKDGSIDIIDYKFTGDRSDEHNTQVRCYVNLMQLIYPNKTIRGYIWYADAKPTPRVTPA